MHLDVIVCVELRVARSRRRLEISVTAVGAFRRPRRRAPAVASISGDPHQERPRHTPDGAAQIAVRTAKRIRAFEESVHTALADPCFVQLLAAGWVRPSLSSGEEFARRVQEWLPCV